MKYLQGKVAFITGATSGIGLAIAHRLAQAGARLALHGLPDAAEGDALCQELARRYDVEAAYFQADLRNAAALEAAMRRVLGDTGGVDILVNNAGMQHVSPVEAFAPEIWNDMLAVNLSAAFHTVRLCLPSMRARDWGRIINIASISGLRGRSGKSAYNATKHGLIGFTKSIALETATTGITCNAICPGWALTPIVQKQVDALAAREQLDDATATHRLISLRQPSGKLVKVEQLAAMAAFLCSADADEVRGAAWTMDGGTTAA
ncbi:SDR family NAD(P)-dependent oxidoreductase [Verticiella sediminum]|uniref:SDR family NAD(P)-dependent oxidoreductase n=1 Tax=Verticiella sediminum TaxID=1247510 RepID=A0A556AEA4_9BURK|nr:3-hydroxybutyrate dehydrogenase [Verticiella sediminum]TSH91224.1 SDR family NAD(P)-dependent oxidoreductase [Verticiella sediminum]